MKIIYVSNSDLGKFGNIAFRTYHVAKEALKRGYLEKLLIRGNCQKDIPKRYIKKIFLGQRFLDLMITYFSMKVSIMKRILLYNLKIWIFDTIASFKIEKCDICHIYDYLPKTIKKSKMLGNITLLDSQVAHPETSDKIQGNPLPREKIKKNNKKFREMVDNSDYVVANSDFVIKTFIDAKINRRKMLKNVTGVDLEKFKPVKKKKNGKFVCLFIGIITKRKGVEYLLKAWDSLKLENAELVLCGRIEENLKNIFKKYKDNKTIRYKGFVDPAIEYKRADVFIFPSLFESCAKATVEAMASGLPMITTFNSGAPYKNNTAGFIIPIKNSKAIEEKIRILYFNKKLREKMGRTARKIAEDLSWEDYGKRMNNIYEAIIKKR